LKSGEVDLAVGYFPDFKKSNFSQQRLFDHTLIYLLRAKHKLRSKRLRLEQFLSRGHAVVRAEARSQEVFERFPEQQNIQRRVVLSTPHFMAIPFAHSDLVVTVPLAAGESFAKFANQAHRAATGNTDLRSQTALASQVPQGCQEPVAAHDRDGTVRRQCPALVSAPGRVGAA
jgi:hypothetical protein